MVCAFVNNVGISPRVGVNSGGGGGGGYIWSGLSGLMRLCTRGVLIFGGWPG